MVSDPRVLLQSAAASPRHELRMDLVLGRAASLRRRRRATVAAGALVVIAVGSIAFGSSVDHAGLPPSHSSPSPTATGGIQTWPVEGNPSRVAVGAGSVWAANTSDGKGWTVTRFDLESGEQLAAIRLGGYARSVAFGDGYFWALVERASTRYVVEIDPATNERVGTPTRLFDTNVGETGNGIAAGGGKAWVGFRGRLYEIDNSTPNTIVVEDDLPGPFRRSDRDDGVYPIAYAGDGVWVAKTSGAVWKIENPATGGGWKHNLGPNVLRLVPGADSLWISLVTPEGRHQLYQQAYSNPSGLRRVHAHLGIYGPGWQPVVGGASLWLVRSAPGENVIELDEATGEEIQSFRYRLDAFYGVAASDDALWLTSQAGRGSELIRIPSGR